MRSLVLAIVVVSLASAAAQNQELVNKEKLNLAGRWRVLSAEAGGKVDPVDLLSEIEVIFLEDVIRIREGKDVRDQRFGIDPAKDPKHIDFTHVAGKRKGATDPGIYLLQGNDLKLAVQTKPNGPRPRAFITQEGDTVSVMTLRRFK